MQDITVFDGYLEKWHLVPDGNHIWTHSSRLLPVRHNRAAAMLKIAEAAEEKFGARLMMWWDGQGAARVLAHDEDALLLERAQNKVSLSALSRRGCDEEATRIMCANLAKLHLPCDRPLPTLIPLSQWFAEIFPDAQNHRGILARSATTARQLLAHPQQAVVLHGDIHHDNILDFGERGWLVIDPKGLWGERGFDYANLFCNPDKPTATNPHIFRHRLRIVTEAAGLERERSLQWILAWAGLSAAWSMAVGDSAELALKVAEMAASEL